MGGDESESASSSCASSSTPSDSDLSDLSASALSDFMDKLEFIDDTWYDIVDVYNTGAGAADRDSLPFFVDVS